MKMGSAIFFVLTSCAGVSVAGQYEFASPAVAGMPGGQTAPLLFIGFRGDGETTDTQADFLYDATRFTAQLTPRNGANCLALAGGRVRLISPGSVVALTGALVRYCEVRFTMAMATPTGSYNFSPDLAMVECFGLNGNVSSCTAPSGQGAIRVGPNTPQAQFLYTPLPDSTVLLVNGTGEIGANFVAGGFGAAIELHDCAITAAVGASFGPVLAAPVPFAFVSNLSGTGLVALTCARQQTDGNGQLSCTETRNGTVASTRSWDLLCPALPPDFIMASDFEDAPP